MTHFDNLRCLTEFVPMSPEQKEMVCNAASEIARLRGENEKLRGMIRLQDAAIRSDSLTLTSAEREALHHVVGDVADITGPVEDTIRGLLERHSHD